MTLLAGDGIEIKKYQAILRQVSTKSNNQFNLGLRRELAVTCPGICIGRERNF
jgi:hypothetical protein